MIARQRIMNILDTILANVFFTYMIVLSMTTAEMIILGVLAWNWISLSPLIVPVAFLPTVVVLGAGNLGILCIISNLVDKQ
jgi:hypothetical protein